MNQAIIAAGSNIKPQYHIEQARIQLNEAKMLLAESQFIQTTPIGNTDQPDFINGAFLIETRFDARQLKAWLKALEDNLGRVRGADKFGPRTIDLDIVVWNKEIVDDEVYERDFLKNSVIELCPELAPLMG
ncbi:MAG: 2-amino-4-hydroxy-6-hydroxymethyldihydropteridine diphosphokinase [SAR324 cluster bacterium]|nr:2-amino-4-hydroxy-6-hydroxymethyldihydropteridine diphosphokinase [SAR324 cluster bacterium]